MNFTHTREALKLAKDLCYLDEDSLNKIEQHIISAEQTASKMTVKENARFRLSLLCADIFLAIIDSQYTPYRVLLVRTFKYSTIADQASI